MRRGERMADLLIVDDNEDIAALVEALMVGEGHEVRVAHDGQAGLCALAERLPELLLLDVDMPILDGPTMAYRMLIENCGKERIPIVLVSANVDLREVARAVGTPYMLRKPFDPDALVRVIGRALSERTCPCPQV
jgi:CheY-like chemotaxis protein